MAATPNTSSVDESQWSRVITDTNRGALVSITAWLMLVAGLMFLGMRLTIRVPWRKLLGADDYMTIVATALAMIHTITTLYAVKHGLGRHVRDLLQNDEGQFNLEKMSRAIYIGEVFLVLGVACSKLSITLLFIRLASGRRHTRPAWFLTAVIVVWGVAASIGVGTTSPFLSPVREDRQEIWPRSWVAIAATNVALEIALFVYPIYLVWDLQMSWKSKATVIIAFGLRLPCSAIACVRLVALTGTSHSATDISWSYVRPAIYTEVEMHYSLIAATIPCMHVFLRHLQTGYLSTTVEQFGADSSRAGTGNESYAMYSSSVSGDKPARATKVQSRDLSGFDFGDTTLPQNTTTTTTTTTPGLHLPGPSAPEQHQHHPDTCTKGKDIVVTDGGWEMRPSGCGGTSTTRVTHSQRGSEGSVTSDGSDRIIIRKTVDVRYES